MPAGLSCAAAGEGATPARGRKSPGMRSCKGEETRKAVEGKSPAVDATDAADAAAPRVLLSLHARWIPLAAASAESAALQPPSVTSPLEELLPASPSVALWYSMVTLAKSPLCNTRTPPPTASKRRLVGTKEPREFLPPPSELE